jgi:hypothetical protein
MRITGEIVQLTPGEAHWAQGNAFYFDGFIPLAQRIQDARVARVRGWLGNAPCSIRDAKASVHNRIQHVMALDRLLLVEKAHEHDTTSPIAVEVRDREKQALLTVARIDYDLAREQIEQPQLREIEDQHIWDDFAMLAATTDVMPADQAVALADMLRDPDAIADFYAIQRTEAITSMAMLGPFIATLEVHLSS